MKKNRTSRYDTEGPKQLASAQSDRSLFSLIYSTVFTGSVSGKKTIPDQTLRTQKLTLTFAIRICKKGDFLVLRISVLLSHTSVYFMMMHLDRYLRGQYSGKMALSKVLLLFGNGVCSKGKNLLPVESKSFPVGVELF